MTTDAQILKSLKAEIDQIVDEEVTRALRRAGVVAPVPTTRRKPAANEARATARRA